MITDWTTDPQDLEREFEKPRSRRSNPQQMPSRYRWIELPFSAYSLRAAEHLRILAGISLEGNSQPLRMIEDNDATDLSLTKKHFGRVSEVYATGNIAAVLWGGVERDGRYHFDSAVAPDHRNHRLGSALLEMGLALQPPDTTLWMTLVNPYMVLALEKRGYQEGRDFHLAGGLNRWLIQQVQQGADWEQLREQHICPQCGENRADCTCGEEDD